MGVVEETKHDIEDFTDWELIDEIRFRGLQGEVLDISDFSDNEIISIAKERKLIVDDKNYIFKLYRSYISESPEQFQKELIKFFNQYGHYP
jgi:hypothetical protein